MKAKLKTYGISEISAKILNIRARYESSPSSIKIIDEILDEFNIQVVKKSTSDEWYYFEKFLDLNNYLLKEFPEDWKERIDAINDEIESNFIKNKSLRNLATFVSNNLPLYSLPRDEKEYMEHVLEYISHLYNIVEKEGSPEIGRINKISETEAEIRERAFLKEKVLEEWERNGVFKGLSKETYQDYALITIGPKNEVEEEVKFELEPEIKRRSWFPWVKLNKEDERL